MTSLDQANFDFLLANARAGKALQLQSFIHLDQPIGLWNYIRIANDIAGQLSPNASILDWGCGYGQMSYLLKQRGFNVTSYDVRPADEVLPDVPLTREISVIVSQEPTKLPFENSRFDAVLSCGVLEHVDEFSQPGNEMKSLAEIQRILKPGGKFLIFQLPQRYAWQESIIRRFKLGYAHPRRYTATEITRMLEEKGFRIEHIHRANLIPKNLTGMPGQLRKIYSKFSRQLIAADGAVCKIPGLNEVAGVLELTALRK